MSAFDEANPQDPDTDPDGSSRQQRVVTILKHLFRQMVTIKDMDTEAMTQVRIKEFVTWCNEHRELWTGVAQHELAAGLKVHIEDLHDLSRTLNDPYDAAALCVSVWHMLCLSGRPPIKHLPSFIDIALTVGFDADTGKEKAFQIRIPTKFKADTPMTDGFLCALLMDQMRAMVQAVAGMGIDTIYEKHALAVSDKSTGSVSETLPKSDPNKRIGDGL